MSDDSDVSIIQLSDEEEKEQVPPTKALRPEDTRKKESREKGGRHHARDYLHETLYEEEYEEQDYGQLAAPVDGDDESVRFGSEQAYSNRYVTRKRSGSAPSTWLEVDEAAINEVTTQTLWNNPSCLRHSVARCL
jgi:hypothetical protein